jgi:orotidine-5'-phosphate decarboxylase
MAFLERIEKLIKERKSYLCVGLDPDLDKFPSLIPKTIDGVYRFLAEIIEATADIAVVYKPNLAFFGSLGLGGLTILGKVIQLAGQETPVILDGKFGDIGNTARKYATMAFDTFGAEAVTLNPYLGSDSILPFLEHKDTYSFILGITSNPGSAEVQQRELAGGGLLYEHLAMDFEKRFPQLNWGWVAGATQPSALSKIRSISPSRFLLIPGIGAQGGELGQVMERSKSPDGIPMALINASRSILYASNTSNFKEAARDAALELVGEMHTHLRPVS